MAQKPRPTISQLKKKAGKASPAAAESAVRKYGGRMTSDAWKRGGLSASPFIPESVRKARKQAASNTPSDTRRVAPPGKPRTTGSGFTSGSYRSKPAPSGSTTSTSSQSKAGGSKANTGTTGGGGGRKRVTVKSGDTLSAIARREGVSLAALKQANKGRAVLDRIYSGSKVIIPKKGKK